MNPSIKFMIFLLIVILLIISFITLQGMEKANDINEVSHRDINLSMINYHILYNEKPKFIDMEQFPKRIENIPYAKSNNERQKLDIIYPTIGKPPFKVIILFHGGGWVKGNKQSASLSSQFLALQQGYAIASIGYRLSDEAKWPAQLYDAKAAIRYIRANGDKYQLDVNRIVVWGNSAGGYLAEMLGATNGMKEMEDLTMGNPNSSSSVQGIVSWFGISDLTTLSDKGTKFANQLMGFDVRKNHHKAKLASPLEYITSEFPPILLVHGTNDQVVPFEQSIDMARKINKITGKKQAHLKIFKGAIHSDTVIKTVENVADNLNFIDKIMYPYGINPYRTSYYQEVKITK